VHVRISSPPVKWPCFYGIDFATRAELLANGTDLDGIRRSIGADSLGYVSLPGLIAATEQPKTRLCRACFDGEYPIELPADNVIGKHVLEGLARTAVSTGPGSAGQREDRSLRVPQSQASVTAPLRGPEPSLPSDARRSGTSEPAGDGTHIVASPGGADALLRP
jgi:amidophosphoribosyltransferase